MWRCSQTQISDVSKSHGFLTEQHFKKGDVNEDILTSRDCCTQISFELSLALNSPSSSIASRTYSARANLSQSVSVGSSRSCTQCCSSALNNYGTRCLK